MKKLNHKRMLEDILKLVDNDGALDMSCKTIIGAKPYTQAEAIKMAECIGNVYSIAHCVYCKACSGKYLKIKKGEKMELREYIELTLSQCDEGVDVEFDIGLDSWGKVDQGSSNRIKFTVSNVEPEDNK